VIRYIDRKDIDDEKWNACLERAFNGNLYGRSWFLDIVADNWAGLVENDYERIFPLVFRRKFGLSYIYQPFFTQQLGLFSTTRLDAGKLEEFIGAIPSRFRRAEMNLNTLNNPSGTHYKIIPQVNHELDLINSYEKIRQGYSENLVRNLKKAEKAGLSVSRNIKPDDIIALFRQNRGKDIGHLGDTDYMRLKRIAYTCMYKGMAGIQGVYDDRNQLVAGAFFIRSHNKAVFLFSGLSDEGRKSGAMPFLIDAYLRHNAGKHLTFDFDGSNDADLARFYKSFGSREVHYQRVIIDRMPALLKIGVYLYKKIKA